MFTAGVTKIESIPCRVGQIKSDCAVSLVEWKCGDQKAQRKPKQSRLLVVACAPVATWDITAPRGLTASILLGAKLFLGRNLGRLPDRTRGSLGLFLDSPFNKELLKLLLRVNPFVN
jgi:hypothetical protein